MCKNKGKFREFEKLDCLGPCNMNDKKIILCIYIHLRNYIISELMAYRGN
jgi:hypothetical protein